MRMVRKHQRQAPRLELGRMKPYYQAHRPEPRWRWYAGLAVECAVLLLAFVVVIAFVTVVAP